MCVLKLYLKCVCQNITHHQIIIQNFNKIPSQNHKTQVSQFLDNADDPGARQYYAQKMRVDPLTGLAADKKLEDEVEEAQQMISKDQAETMNLYDSKQLQNLAVEDV